LDKLRTAPERKREDGEGEEEEKKPRRGERGRRERAAACSLPASSFSPSPPFLRRLGKKKGKGKKRN